MDYSKIVEAQRSFFNSNATKDLGFRIAQLKKFRNLLRNHEKEIYASVYNDFRKSEFETYGTELSIIYQELNMALRNIKRWASKKRVATNIVNLPGCSVVQPEPLGVCLIIGAWNYPFQLTFVPLISAIAAGNCAIIKPSELPHQSSIAIANLINNHFPPEYLKVVHCDIAATGELLKEKFDKIFFTGSISTGKIIYEAAAKHLTPVTLELGGKSPAVITADTDLKHAAQRIVWAKFLNAGQTCIAPDYLFVHKNAKQEFLKYLVHFISKFNYSIENSNYVQIINTAHFQRLTAMIDKTKLYFGGKTNQETLFIEPTLLTEIPFDHSIMAEEIFGPILPIIDYENFSEVIEKIKSKPKPLSAYLFTRVKRDRLKFMHELSFGGGAINDAVMQISNSYLPFGGVGVSGFGSYHGKHGFKNFSHYKSILNKPYWLEPNLKYAPYSKGKLSWIKRLMGL
jgi:aldehyde dehydrogenase (NAD+)